MVRGTKRATAIIMEDSRLVNNTLKPAIIWGGVSFLLLYRTFPSDVTLWWNVLTQWNFPVWQLMVTWAASILPALIPLMCFILLNNKQQCSRKYIILMPFIAWLIGRFILVVIIWMITFKISNEPTYSGGFQNTIVHQIGIMYWNSQTLVSALIIITCSYAFWRERKLRNV